MASHIWLILAVSTAAASAATLAVVVSAMTVNLKSPDGSIAPRYRKGPLRKWYSDQLGRAAGRLRPDLVTTSVDGVWPDVVVRCNV